MSQNRDGEATLNNGIWSAAERGDAGKVAKLLAEGKDVNGRNCLGCTPLLYACGSGNLETVQILLEQSEIDVNRRNNDRLTSFMLAMQGGPAGIAARMGHQVSWPGWEEGPTNAHEQLRRLMDFPATDDLESNKNDKWTALMEACNFGHKAIVEALIAMPAIDLDAVNLRGQKADDVAAHRGHEQIVQLIRLARLSRDQPEELPRIRELEEQVETLKQETRHRLLQNIDARYDVLSQLKLRHENEIEVVTRQIDCLHEQLEDAMKSRLSMITRQVREVKNIEDEIRQMKRKLENFDRYASSGTLNTGCSGNGAISSATCGASLPSVHSHRSVGGSFPDFDVFDKDFECSVCMEDMRPPTKIFQCFNGHVMCETCKDHPEVLTCPTCRIPLPGPSSLLRNIPMEKLARSYFDRIEQTHLLGGASGATYSASPSHASPSIGGSRLASSRHNSGCTSRTGSRRGSLGTREQLGFNLSNNIGRMNAGGLSHSSDFLG